MNKNFAIKLVAEEPVTDVESRVVSCDGGGGALGHPKVYINLVNEAALKKITRTDAHMISLFLYNTVILYPNCVFSSFYQDKDTKIGTCGYCGLRFKQKHHH